MNNRLRIVFPGAIPPFLVRVVERYFRHDGKKRDERSDNLIVREDQAVRCFWPTVMMPFSTSENKIIDS